MPDEVGGGNRVKLRKTEFLLAKGDGLHQKGHVLSQIPDGGDALQVLRRFAGGAAVDTVPVMAGRDGHSADGEILVQLVKGGRAAAPAGNHHGRADLHPLVKAGAVEQPIQKRHQRGVGRGIIDRAGGNQTVSFPKRFRRLVDRVVKDAFAGLPAASAGDAATDGLIAHVENFGFDVLGGEDFRHLGKGIGRISVCFGASVEQQYLHLIPPEKFGKPAPVTGDGLFCQCRIGSTGD